MRNDHAFVAGDSEISNHVAAALLLAAVAEQVTNRELKFARIVARIALRRNRREGPARRRQAARLSEVGRIGHVECTWPLLLGDFTRISAQDRAHYAAWIAQYNHLRQQLPLDQSFFPLGAWRQPRSGRWDGFARLSRQGAGLIVLFPNNAPDKTARVRIPGFPDVAVTARVWDSAQTFQWTGAQLRNGVEIPLSGEDAEVVELR